MTDTNQLPPSEREAFEAFAQNCPMGKYSITRRGDGYDSSHTQLMWDAWQARAQATQAEVTDAEIVAVMRDGNNCNYNDEAEHIQFARAILAMRPVQVPMTDLPEGDVTYFDGRGDAVDGYTAERVWEILRSHGITAQAKKEGA